MFEAQAHAYVSPHCPYTVRCALTHTTASYASVSACYTRIALTTTHQYYLL